jgi:hypothetical protein
MAHTNGGQISATNHYEREHSLDYNGFICFSTYGMGHASAYRQVVNLRLQGSAQVSLEWPRKRGHSVFAEELNKMSGKLKITDLTQNEAMDRAAMQAVSGGAIAERFLFSGPSFGVSRAAAAPVFNISNLTYQDDRDTIIAGENAQVINFGGNYASSSNVSSTVDLTSNDALQGSIQQFMRNYF